jgi:hypothetical protein
MTSEITLALEFGLVGKRGVKRTSWVRHDCAPNTRNVTTQERNTRLLQPAVRLLRPAQEAIDLRHGGLEGRELDHGVRDLTRPQGVQSLVESTNPLLSDDLAPALPQITCERRVGGLHAHLDSLERAQCDVSEELSRRGRRQENDCLGRSGSQLLAVQVLEDFVEAVLASALHRVADECGRPPGEDAAQPFFRVDQLPCLRVGLVQFGVDLAAAFDLELARQWLRTWRVAGGAALCVRTRSRGVTMVCVGPHAMMPPSVHAAK